MPNPKTNSKDKKEPASIAEMRAANEANQMPAMVVPLPLWAALMDHFRDTPAPPKVTQPLLDQCSQLQPQQVTIRND